LRNVLVSLLVNVASGLRLICVEALDELVWLGTMPLRLRSGSLLLLLSLRIEAAS